MKSIIFNVIFPLILLASFSCKKSETPSNSYPMEMRMTDAAGPYDAVYIDVQSVEVLSDNNSSNWVTLNTNAGIYDLTRLVNGRDTFFGAATLSSGSISQIRLILGTNNSVVIKGQSYPLKTPSAQQSGLKLNVNYSLVAGVNYVILLDFDANKSIVKTGNGEYTLKPVLRTSTAATSGAIIGVVTPASANPEIFAISGSDSIGTFSDAFGNFRFNGMSSGTYSIAFVPVYPLPIKIVNNVSVSVGNVTDVGLITIQ